MSADIRERCSECGACVRNCAFLTQHGTPRAIASTRELSDPRERRIAYQCSLCGLCTALCPEGLDPCSMFLEIRRHDVEAGCFASRPYRSLLRYEALGNSRLFTYYGLPAGSDTAFFPGCTFSGTRPAVTRRLYRELRRHYPSLGIVLACCAKPSHDLGRMAHFRSVFGELLDRLSVGGVRTVLTACPNCTKIFRQYGQGMSVQTVYEILHRHGVAESEATATGGGEISVHDPCPLRDHHEAQSAVRGLLTDMGYTCVEMPHRKKMTLCCGEGGAVGCTQPDNSRGWAERRKQESEGRKLVTYCAGCTHFLGQATPTVHILDMIFRANGVSDNDISVSKGPVTYLNRLLLKLRLMAMSAPGM